MTVINAERTRKTEIEIRSNAGGYWGDDWAKDYFSERGMILGYDDFHNAYIVEDVEECIRMANSTTDPAGARYIADGDGNPIPFGNKNILVSWDHLDLIFYAVCADGCYDDYSDGSFDHDEALKIAQDFSENSYYDGQKIEIVHLSLPGVDCVDIETFRE